MLNLPRGCRDFSPEDMEKRWFLENSFRETARRFNFREISMPTFEHSELFIRKSGEEIVKQLYIFEDKGGRSMALRPEMTVQALRFYTANFQYEPKPLKFFYFGNCFRYERPQKGRYREFWQFGAEIIGTRTPEASVELLTLANAMYSNMGLQKYIFKVGNVGILRNIFHLFGFDDVEKKTAFTLLDKDNFDGFKGFLEEKGITINDTLLDLLSRKWPKEDSLDIFKQKLDNTIQRAIGNYPPSDEQLASDLRKQAEDFYKVVTLFSAINEDFKVDLSIARGLDYYTNMVFEIEVESLGAESQVCGGGEYSLDQVFGIDSKGCLGFAIGFDRSLLALEEEGREFDRPELLVYIIAFKEYHDFAFQLLNKLRQAGISADVELSGRGLGKAFKYADKQGARYTVVIGEDEVKSGLLSVKDMKAQTQEKIVVDDIVNYLKAK